MLNSLRRRARKVGLGIHKQHGEDWYMVYDIYTTGVVVFYGTEDPYPHSLEDVEEIICKYEEADSEET